MSLHRSAAHQLAGPRSCRRARSAIVAKATTLSSSAGGHQSSTGLETLFLSDISLVGQRTPLLLGFINYFERHVPNVGFFEPIAAEALASSELKIDRHVEL